MLYYGYSITSYHWLPLVAPSVMYLWYTPMQSNHRGLHTSKNLEIPKGRTILSWGRLYHNKLRLHTFRTNKPKTTICAYYRQTHATYPNINNGLY